MHVCLCTGSQPQAQFCTHRFYFTLPSCLKPHSKTTFRAVLLSALACYTPSLFLLLLFSSSAIEPTPPPLLSTQFFLHTPFAEDERPRTKSRNFLLLFFSSVLLPKPSLAVVGCAECRPHEPKSAFGRYCLIQ